MQGVIKLFVMALKGDYTIISIEHLRLKNQIEDAFYHINKSMCWAKYM